MIKTYTTNLFHGTMTTKVELQEDAIVILEQNGRSLKNEFGGYPCLHVGSKQYLAKKFSQLGK